MATKECHLSILSVKNILAASIQKTDFSVLNK